MSEISPQQIVDVPKHVPAKLVRIWDYEAAPGAAQDPHAANSVLTKGPEIFYSPTTIAQTELGGWMITRNHIVREIMQDPETFSSYNLTGWPKLLGEDWKIIPIESDSPEHGLYRTLMNPIFSPKRMDSMIGDIRQSAVDLIEAQLPAGECEFGESFGRPLPVKVFLRLMGLPLDMMDQFIEWENVLLHGKFKDRRRAGAQEIKKYLLSVIEERRKHPKDDLVSFAVSSKVGDRMITDDETMGMCFVLFAAGLDTVANMLGYTFKHLAENPQHQQALRENLSLIPHAMEEMIRAYSIIQTNRVVTMDIEFHGVKMKKGDRIILPLAIIGRDEAEYDNPNTVDFKRENVRHISFGSGPHRCIGSHLARVEIRIALEEWLTRAPPFRIADGKAPEVQAISVWGLKSLPLAWS